MAPESCKCIYKENNEANSGMYTVCTRIKCDFKVFCDMSLPRKGGWTVIQRRVNNDIPFNRTWNSYVIGFGNILNGSFFLGLEKIHALTESGTYELYIGMQDHGALFKQPITKYALYRNFKVLSSESQYTLMISGYDKSSNAGDSFSSHNGAKFSTFDHDNDEKPDGSCAQRYKSGWWFKNCFDANLNGVWIEGGSAPKSDGISWELFGGDKYSLKTVVMAIRSVDDC